MFDRCPAPTHRRQNGMERVPGSGELHGGRFIRGVLPHISSFQKQIVPPDVAWFCKISSSVHSVLIHSDSYDGAHPSGTFRSRTRIFSRIQPDVVELVVRTGLCLDDAFSGHGHSPRMHPSADKKDTIPSESSGSVYRTVVRNARIGGPSAAETHRRSRKNRMAGRG